MKLVAEKFKQTEVGLIPSDWEVKKLGDYSFITKLAGFEYTLHFNSYKDEGDIIVVRGTNITHNKLDLNDVRTIPRTTSNFLQRSKLFRNDLVFAYVGTIGPIYLVEEDDRFHLGPNTAKITVNKELDSMFLFHYFTSSFLKKEIIEHTSIGAQPSLSMSKIRSFKIILPLTKAEQIAIATALSDAGALISSLEKLITKKRNIKQGAMQKLLQPKEGWEVKKLGEVFIITAGGDLDTQTFSLIQDDKYCYPIYSNALTSKGLYGYTSEYKQIENTITVTARGQVGVAIPRDHKYCAIGRVIMLTPSLELSINFISECINNFIEFSNESTGVPQLTAPQISKYEISIPVFEEQTRIANILSDMDAEIAALEVKLEKYRNVKLGMMQNLLTGKIRLV